MTNREIARDVVQDWRARSLGSMHQLISAITAALDAKDKGITALSQGLGDAIKRIAELEAADEPPGCPTPGACSCCQGYTAGWEAAKEAAAQLMERLDRYGRTIAVSDAPEAIRALEPPGPAGSKGQVGWMGGEFDR